MTNPLSETAQDIIAAETAAHAPRSKPVADVLFTIYSRDARGLNVAPPLREGLNAWSGTEATILGLGEEMDITAAIVEANADREGVSWLNFTDEEQRQRWGVVRFGKVDDDHHLETQQTALRLERDRLARERQNLLRRNPSARRATGAARIAEESAAKIAELDAQIIGR